jgi:hypothetical protein
MLHDKLALLRTLALRPSRDVVPSLRPLVEQLAAEGYVVRDSDAGWMTTVRGCNLIESSRPSGASSPGPRKHGGPSSDEEL